MLEPRRNSEKAALNPSFSGCGGGYTGAEVRDAQRAQQKGKAILERNKTGKLAEPRGETREQDGGLAPHGVYTGRDP